MEKTSSCIMALHPMIILLAMGASRTTALTTEAIDFSTTEKSMPAITQIQEEQITDETINNDVNGYDNGDNDKMMPEEPTEPPLFELPPITTIPPRRPTTTPFSPPFTTEPWSRSTSSSAPPPVTTPYDIFTRYTQNPTIPTWSRTTYRPVQETTQMEVRTEPNYPNIPDNSVSDIGGVSCDFGNYPQLTLCEWRNGLNASLTWRAGSGIWANWLGGPSKDLNTNTSEGGYVFVETSQVPSGTDSKWNHPGGSLESPILGSTGPKGTCLSFGFAINGLSPAGFRVLLEDVDMNGDNIINGGHKGGEHILWEAQYHSQGAWQAANLLYNYLTPHKLVIVGESADTNHPSRLYRGHIAVDMLLLRPGIHCQGFCTFAGGFCDWGNEAGDEFDWSLSRGSSNPVTGPTMDSSSKLMSAGSYAFIDSEFPRRPGDIARLVSSTFPPTGNDSPLCMRFWFHMFGPAVGTLRVLLRRVRVDAFFPLELWSISGSAGNAWFMAQVTVSSLHEYQIVLEGYVGNTAMSDIAVDDITFAEGPCPVAPQVASPSSGDCSFEVDECGWVDGGSRNSIQWERIPARSQKPRNRRPPLTDTHAANSKNEYFLGLGSRTLPHMDGTARLTSRTFEGSNQPRCLSFWFLMSEPFIDVSGSSLGALQVLTRTERDAARPSSLSPVWKLYNNQGSTWQFAQIPIKEASNYSIVFEGFWGPNRASGSIAIDDIVFYNGDCRLLPMEAHIQPEDCSFHQGLCGWHNWTRARGEGKSGERVVAWQRAADTHRPSQILDNTFGTTDGFLFFDIFATNHKESAVMLVSSSMKMRDNVDAMCFTFWYAAFGAGESTHLLVLRTGILDDPDHTDRETLWQLTPDGLDTSRPTWSPAQVNVDARSPFKLVLEGKASNGGFAVDDIRLVPGQCKTRPPEARPKN